MKKQFIVEKTITDILDNLGYGHMAHLSVGKVKYPKLSKQQKVDYMLNIPADESDATIHIYESDKNLEKEDLLWIVYSEFDEESALYDSEDNEGNEVDFIRSKIVDFDFNEDSLLLTLEDKKLVTFSKAKDTYSHKDCTVEVQYPEFVLKFKCQVMR